MKVRSKAKLALFALSATGTWLITAASPNFPKRLSKGWRRWYLSDELIISKGQGQVKLGHQIKMPQECRATYVLWAIWKQKPIAIFLCKFDPRKGQFQINIGLIRSNFQIQNFLLKTCLSYPLLSQDSRNVIYFYVRQLEMPKIAFKNVTLSRLPFHIIFYHFTALNRDIALKFGMYVVCM